MSFIVADQDRSQTRSNRNISVKKVALVSDQRPTVTEMVKDWIDDLNIASIVVQFNEAVELVEKVLKLDILYSLID